jgi:hypothetical protein
MFAMRLVRAIPRPLRHWLLARVPPPRRLWLVNRLLGSRRSRAPAGVGSTVRVRVRAGGRGGVSAIVRDDASPLAVRQHNLDEVVRALTGAGISYFCLPADSDLRSAVAVSLDDQPQVLAALASSPGLAGAQVHLVSPDTGARIRSPGRRAVARVFQPVTNPARTLVLDGRFACDVEFWRQSGPDLTGPHRHSTTCAAPLNADLTEAPASVFSRFVPYLGDGPQYPTKPDFAQPNVEQATFPIDAVYTWVDGSDPDWRERKNAALRAQGAGELSEIAANDSRYANRDELRYSLRSLVCYAPWIRHVYLVSDDQLPPWLDVTHPMITVVRHREIFGDTGMLPTFNSHAIETRLHRIPGLAEHFIYINDDMFFGRPVVPNTFFHANGIAKFFMSPAQLDLGEATVRDTPVTAAGKNNRRLISEKFGRTISRKMRHVPYPLRRSVLEEIEAAAPDAVLGTAGHQFRHPADFSIPSSLQHYWSFLTSRAVPGSIRYTYADLTEPHTPVVLGSMLARRYPEVFCLNDTDSADVPFDQQYALLTEFLPAYFPFRAPFELPDEVAAQRAGRSATALADELPPGSPRVAA